MTETPGDGFHDETAVDQVEPTWDDPEPEAEAPDLEPTGHRRIDEALERLERLDGTDVSTHPEEFDAIHGVLRESLANAGRDEDVAEPA